MNNPDRDPRMEDSLEELLSSEQLPEGSSAEARGIFGFVRSCREAAQEPLVDTGLTDRALASTTREDLSWRGDMRVVQAFVRERLRSSGALRLAAASLILHLAALPVLALYIFTEKEPPLQFRVDVGERKTPFAEESPEEPVSDLEISDLPEFHSTLVVNTLAWSRLGLEESQDLTKPNASPVPEWLVERHDLLFGGGPREVVQVDSPIPDDLLTLELFLDGHLVGPTGFVFDREGFRALGKATDLCRGAEGPIAFLAAAALARAESYGLSDSDSRAALGDLRSSLGANDPLRPLLEVNGEVRAFMPIDPLWLEAVRAVDINSVPIEYLRHIRKVGARRQR